MDTGHTTLARDTAGFFLDGLLAAVSAGLVFVAFFPLPIEHDPRNHTGSAFGALVPVVFFCAGFIGRRTISADFSSELLPSLVTSYLVIMFLCLTASLDLAKTSTMIGFATVGFVISTAVVTLVGRRFPPKTEIYQV